MVKVLVISKDILIGESITSILSGDKDILSKAVNDDYINHHGDIHPDIILFPVHMYSEFMMKQISSARKEWGDAKLLLLMSVYDDRFIVQGLKSGVDGFLIEEDVLREEKFQQYIHDLHEDGNILSGKIARNVMLEATSRNKREQLYQELLNYDIRLSARELDVAYRLMQGYTNLDISIQLGLKEKSIRDYVSMVYRKIGINRRKAAIKFLVELTGEREKNGV